MLDNKRGKNNVIIRNISILSFFAAMAVFVIMIMMDEFNKQPSWIKKKTTELETPFYFDLNQEYCSEITDYYVYDDKLYLLYGLRYIMKVYSLDGSYICSWAFKPAEGRRSKGNLGQFETMVIYEDPSINWYCFKGDQFLSFSVREDREVKYVFGNNRKNTQMLETGDYVTRKGDTFSLHYKNGDVFVIYSRSWLFFVFSSNFVFALYGLLLITALVCNAVLKKYEDKL